MSKMIQIRNVPDAIHRTLKTRAAATGMSLSDYLLREIGSVAERPTIDEVLARIRRRGSTGVRQSSASAVRAERESRR